MKILFEISYVGTAYHGYQIQNGRDIRTVQGTLQESLEKLFGERYRLSGCSRTDAGVHARQFFCTADDVSERSVPEDKIPIAAAAFLPGDISVRSARYVGDAFHPRYDVDYKEYEYTVLNTRLSDPFLFGKAYHYPKALDVEAMDRAAKGFVGTHDFASFMAQGSSVTSTVRTVKYFDVRRNGDLVIMRVAADGFLYNMVRILCGTLIALSEGRIKEDEIATIIESRDRSRAGATLPPDGLCLTRVVYPERVFSPDYVGCERRCDSDLE